MAGRKSGGRPADGVSEKGMGETIMTSKTWVHAALLFGVMGTGFSLMSCGEAGEGPIVAPPDPPAEYADKHMPAGWWADEVKAEEGRKLFIGETNPDVNCASCHGKDGKPVKAGARDFRVADRMKLYSDSVWFWRMSEGVPNTKMKAWKSKLSEEDRWKLVAFERNFGLKGQEWDMTAKAWVPLGSAKAVAAAADGKDAKKGAAPAGGKKAATPTSSKK
jgi:mono/diheme cytochrome c family protein